MAKWQSLALVALAAWSLPGAAGADEIDHCLAAHPQAQRLRQAGKLRESRAQLLVCAREICPGVVRADCGQWLTEVDALTPTVVVSARTASGADIPDALLFVDGERAQDGANGREMPLDPGTHRLRVEAGALAPAEQVIVVREREKARPVVFTMAARTPPPAPAEAPRSWPTSVYVLGAVGALALGSFAYFGVSGRAEYFDVKDRCSPACTSSDVAPMRAKLVVADVSAAIALVALGAAAYLLLTRPAPKDARF